MTRTTVLPVYPVILDQAYEYRLGISSDSLLILSNKNELVEAIIVGKDKDGWVCTAETENDFLESISVIKQCIKNGLNPLLLIL